MARQTLEILEAVDSALAVQQAELAEERSRQTLVLTSNTATGSANIDQTFSLDRRFRLVFLRCHFSGTLGKAPLSISLDSIAGAAYDALLYTIAKAGTGEDVYFRIAADENREPSPWTFQASDGIRVQWTNSDSGNITWGLEVGLAIAT